MKFFFILSMFFFSCAPKEETVTLDSLRKETDSNYVQQSQRNITGDRQELTTWVYFNFKCVKTIIDTLDNLDYTTADNRNVEGKKLIQELKLKR